MRNRIVSSIGLACLLSLAACDRSKLIPLHQFESLAAAPTVSLRVMSYQPMTGNQPSDFFVHNFSYRLSRARLLLDLDGDGVPDGSETAELNLSAANPDTSGFGYGDYFIFRMGLSRETQRVMAPCPTGGADSDNDGLSDCAEASLGSDASQWDTARGGIPDGLAFRAGLDPSDPAEPLLDSAGDGWNNLVKIRAGIPIDEPASVYKNYAVKIQQEFTSANCAGCFDYLASNLPIVPVAGGNRIELYFVERDALGRSSLRTASVLIPSDAAGGSTFERNFTELGVSR